MKDSMNVAGTWRLPADRIWVDPDCGLKTRTVEEARDKLEAMMTAVREARARAGATLLLA